MQMKQFSCRQVTFAFFSVSVFPLEAILSSSSFITKIFKQKFESATESGESFKDVIIFKAFLEQLNPRDDGVVARRRFELRQEAKMDDVVGCCQKSVVFRRV